MFNDVRVLDKNGMVKKVVTSRELSRRHWAYFLDRDHKESVTAKERKLKTRRRRAS